MENKVHDVTPASTVVNQNNVPSFPSSAEIGIMLQTNLDNLVRQKVCVGSRKLYSFLRDTASNFITPKGSEDTNIIDQRDRVTYNFNQSTLNVLFRHLEECRLEGTITHFSERQGTTASPKSGLMIDYDMVLTNPKPILTDRFYFRLAQSLVGALQKDIDFASHISTPEYKFHIFFIIKPEAVPIDNTNSSIQTYKYGIHLLVPGIKLSRAYKKLLIHNFKSDPGALSALRELGGSGDTKDYLDQNSASVPVLFIGSCKRGAIPYILGNSLEIEIDISSNDWTPPPVIRKLGTSELTTYNLVAELSLITEAEYPDGRAPLVRMKDFEVRSSVADLANHRGLRFADDINNPTDLEETESDISILNMHDPQFRHTKNLLGMLDITYCTERNKWRNVIFALANTNEKYKPLAVWFSQQCPKKWIDNGMESLESLWVNAVAQKSSNNQVITIKSLEYWARKCNPSKYAEIVSESYSSLLFEYVINSGGKLQHYMLAKILYAMLGNKYCVDIDVGSRGSQTYCWYEFVLPGESQRPGEVWKWRKEVEPDNLHIYMSEKIYSVMNDVSIKLEDRRIEAKNEELAKHFVNIAKSFVLSKLNIYNDTFKNGTVRQANYLFRRRGFVEQLDTNPDLFGTSNGVLHLGAKCVLIDHYHEYPISKFSPVAYVKFNPESPDPWQQLVLDAITDIIPEPDARDWILFHAAQGLSSGPKEGIMLLWEGGGQNGKTSFLRWIAKALGPYADKFNIQLMSSSREDADRPNSAMMRFKHLNYAYSEESNKAQSLNVARMKEMVNAGEVSGRDLNSKQETFTMKTNMVAASQYSFIIDTTDHGTWRRLRHYTSKTKFRKNPDPNNPLEKADDQRFVRQFPTDPQFQSAVFGVLTHYYERLQTEYGGELKNVSSPTIDNETDVFRIRQDSLHRWISQSVVSSPLCTTEYTVAMLSNLYIDWLVRNIRQTKPPAFEIIKEIESSAIGKYLRPTLNRTLSLKGYRILADEDMDLRAGEEMLIHVERRGTDSDTKNTVDSTINRLDGRKWWESRLSISVANILPTVTDSDTLRDDYAIMVATVAPVLASISAPELHTQLTDNIDTNPTSIDDIDLNELLLSED